MGDLPTGVVTFLFTDVEGSTRLWDEHPEAMAVALARHDAILREAVADHDGQVVKMTGDGVHAVFATATDALAAAVEAQLALQRVESADALVLKVRMGAHSCAAELRDGDYYGSTVNRAARVMSAAHGGQIVASLATCELARDTSLQFVDLGEHQLVGLVRPEQLFQVVHPDLPHEFPPLRALTSDKSNLPVQLTAFVGRERELDEIANVLETARVVTVTGIGGVGKTRVALELAARNLSTYRDGAWFCELAPVTDPNAVVEVIATTLSVSARPGQSIDDSLLDSLRAKRLLLVLDNCEHLLDSVAAVVDRVVRACAEVAVLATSREGLGVSGERIVAVGSLGLPDQDAPGDVARAADAVELFAARATDARSDFVLSDENLAAVVEICRRLDGIALAIELAAARVQSMTPTEIATRLADQFRLLRGGTRGGVERHQTLRRAIDWSYDLLNDDERHVLDRLSVFAGGATLEDAEAVLMDDTIATFDVLEHLSALVRRSLVSAEMTDGHTRYRLLETVRQYAHDRLDQSDSVAILQRRHAEHFASLSQNAGPHLRGPDQLEWLGRLSPEIDNLRAAQSWAIDHGDLDLALAVVVPLCVNGTAVGYTAFEWAGALAMEPEIDMRPLGPTLLARAAFRAAIAGDFDRALALDARRAASEAALGVEPNFGSYEATFAIAVFSPNPASALDLCRRCVEMARDAGDDYDLVKALTSLGACLSFAAPMDEAIAVLRTCLAEARRLANPSTLSLALATLGVHLVEVDPTESIALVEEAIHVGTTVGNQLAVALANGALARLYSRFGDQDATVHTYLATLDVYPIGQYHHSAIPMFIGIASALVASGHDEAAAVLQGASDAVMQPEVPVVSATRDHTITTLRRRLGDEKLTSLLARGAAMAFDDIVPYARASLEAIQTTPAG